MWWFTSSCTVDGLTMNDLRLWFVKDLLLYQHQAADSSVSNIVVKAFSRHLRYLTLEMVPLSLFSWKLNEMEKLELADCLLALKPKEPIPFPQCQIVLGMVSLASQKNVDSCPTLAHLSIFTLLNNDHSFLVADVLSWPDPPVYLSQCSCQNWCH